MPRHLLLNTASWHLLLLASILPHSTSPSSFLALSYFCGGFTWITHPYLTDSLGQNDFHLDNSGRQNHRIAPRRAPKCPRRYFSVSLHCSTHCYSSKSLPISGFCDSWSNTSKKTDLSNAVVVLTSPHGKEDHSVSWHTKGMQKMPAKLWWALRKQCPDHRQTGMYQLASDISLKEEFGIH